jgi:cytochrome c551/c552
MRLDSSGDVGDLSRARLAVDCPIAHRTLKSNPGRNQRCGAAYNCQACHSMYNSSLPGPSWIAIARRYSSDTNAVGDLEASVVNGSSGAWGDSAIPPNNIPDDDLDVLLVWILQLI